MPIIRSKALSEFFVMHNATAQDKNLSWAARGMLCYLLSKPEGWKTSMADLARQTKAGKSACQAAFKELLDNGYAVRKQTHRNGRLVWDTEVYDRPILTHKTSDYLPAEIQCIENLPAENCVVYKEQSLENTDIERTEKKESLSVSKKNGRQSYPEVFEKFWTAWQPYQTPPGNKKEAFMEWTRHVPPALGVDELIAKAQQYHAECRRTDTNTKHVCRWIKYRGWEQDYGPPVSGYNMAMAALERKWEQEDAEQQGPDKAIGDRSNVSSLPLPVGRRQES